RGRTEPEDGTCDGCERFNHGRDRKRNDHVCADNRESREHAGHGLRHCGPWQNSRGACLESSLSGLCDSKAESGAWRESLDHDQCRDSVRADNSFVVDPGIDPRRRKPDGHRKDFDLRSLVANDSGPGKFTFDVSTGALLTTSGGGGGTQNVNITQVNGRPVAMGNPLPVELSDGTNPFGTNANPLFAVGPTSNTANAPAQ